MVAFTVGRKEKKRNTAIANIIIDFRAINLFGYSESCFSVREFQGVQSISGASRYLNLTLVRRLRRADVKRELVIATLRLLVVDLPGKN